MGTASIISEKKAHLDVENMFQVLKDFPIQVKSALELADNHLKNFPEFEYEKIVISGMGGSAIAGDLAKSFFNSIAEFKYPIFVNRNYDIPAFVDEKTLFVASSYSGNTEETISALSLALKKTKQIFCICSGGELFDYAQKNNLPTIKIPTGYQPRLALGYLFFPLLKALCGKLSPEFRHNLDEELNQLIVFLQKLSDNYSNISSENIAISFAEKIHNKIVVIYSDCEYLDSVNARWRAQIQENAKQLCFGNFLPEMNHNEINSFSFPQNLKGAIAVVILLDKIYHPRTQIRCEALKKILVESQQLGFLETITSQEDTFLNRMFELIYFGDWVSYYLALLNDIAPTPIPVISKLKNYLWENR